MGLGFLIYTLGSVRDLCLAASLSIVGRILAGIPHYFKHLTAGFSRMVVWSVIRFSMASVFSGALGKAPCTSF